MSDSARYLVEIRITDTVPREMLARAPEVFDRHLDLALQRAANDLASREKSYSPKAFSNLVNSIRAVKMGILHWSVAPGVAHGLWAELGRNPGKQPGVGNGLLEWIRLKVDPSASGKKLDRLGFVIARSIARKGIKAQPFVRPSVVIEQMKVAEHASRAMQNAIAELNGAASG